jgi:hypothetical protein
VQSAQSVRHAGDLDANASLQIVIGLDNASTSEDETDSHGDDSDSGLSSGARGYEPSEDCEVFSSDQSEHSASDFLEIGDQWSDYSDVSESGIPISVLNIPMTFSLRPSSRFRISNLCHRPTAISCTNHIPNPTASCSDFHSASSSRSSCYCTTLRPLSTSTASAWKNASRSPSHVATSPSSQTQTRFSTSTRAKWWHSDTVKFTNDSRFSTGRGHGTGPVPLAIA